MFWKIKLFKKLGRKGCRFTSLPPELLLLVFEYLGSEYFVLAATCRSLFGISRDVASLAKLFTRMHLDPWLMKMEVYEKFMVHNSVPLFRSLRISEDSLLKSVDKERLALLKHVLKFVDPRINDNYAIVKAARSSSTEILKVLLNDKRIDPSCNNNKPFRNACDYGKIDAAVILLNDPRVDPGALNNQAIRLCCKHGYVELVKILLKHPMVDPGADNNYAIRISSMKSRPEILKLLLKHPKVDATVLNDQVIQWASNNDNSKVMKVIMRNKNRGVAFQVN